ncbi:hypothetical protein [uncultured Dokdonia sp.]|uniref:hypothetical protein n=1 Tax=uncultured Dokdonia sp. TaxID=575653 RepID=UPI00260625DE|nr:hypothetical protein [uncultured Dokdonia sp.]
MRNIILSLVLLFSYTGIAQEPFLSFEHTANTLGKKATQLFAATFPENNKFLIFIEDKKQLSVYQFDESGQEIQEAFSFPNFAKKYPNIGGYLYQNEKYTLFLSTFNKKKWAIVSLDFKTKSYNLQETKLDIKGDRVLESLTYNGKHYLFTLKKDSSTFEVYALDADGAITTQIFPFEDIDFGDGRRTIPNLDRLLQSSFSRDAAIIDSDSPIALESSKSKNKFYQEEALVTLTIDASKKHTFYLQFDLENKIANAKTISKASFDKDILSAKSNSFIFEDKLFVLKVSSDEMDFSIYRIDSMENLASFSAKKGTPIGFKNTPIIQEGGDFDSYRELEKTSKFLRKVATSNPAIAVFKNNGNYIITLGATKEISQGGPTFFVYGGGLAGAVVSGLITGIANATYYQYNAYSYTKSARFLMVLDSDLQFIPNAEIPLNAFDEIGEFTQETSPKVIQTVFKLNDFYVWGALDAKNSTLNFFKF